MLRGLFFNLPFALSQEMSRMQMTLPPLHHLTVSGSPQPDSRSCMALNKSSSQRAGPPCAGCSTGTSLAGENQGEQGPSPWVTRALTVGACTAPAQRPCACVPVSDTESCCDALDMPTCLCHVQPDGSQTASSHTRCFHLTGSGAFTTSSFCEAITWS